MDLLRVLGRRLPAMVVLLLLVTIITYSLVLFIPGDPAVAIAGEDATAADIEETRRALGLDQPLPVQYGTWLARVAWGDLGTSLYTGESVGSAIADRLPVTLSLTAGAIIVALVIALPAGMIAATHRGRLLDRLATIGASFGVAAPGFWVALMLVVIFALQLGWLPATGYVDPGVSVTGWFSHLILPSVALGLVPAAELTRQLRGAMIEVLDQDYIRTAYAKGLRGRAILLRHGLKNAASPVVTVFGMQIAFLLGGSLITEQIFALPGLGQLTVRAVLENDLPMIQGVVVVSAVFVLLANLAVDLSYGYFNPKVRA